MADVETIEANDVTGLRNNISDVLDLARKKELEAIVIVYRDTDKRITTYWNGDDIVCSGLCQLADHDIQAGIPTDREKSYDPLPGKEVT